MDVMTIEKDGDVYAKIFQADIEAQDGVRFVTQDEDPLQVGIFEREAGYEVVPHKHKSRELHLQEIGEFLWIQKGSATVKVFDDDWNVVGEKNVHAGDCIVFLKGGHGLIMNENARILEVKQGPYPGREQEKTFKPET